ncbi:MAG: NAD(P)-dependent oxidoreductase [Fibrobacteria bacterium]|nr:NAD(P)-dependent oxidoreductase [Fibrobacteria bacterium]
MKRILVTGASGFLGWNLCRLFSKNHLVTGSYFSHRPAITSTKNLQLKPIDLTRGNDVFELIRKIRPEAIIHTAAQSNPEICQKNPQESYAINVESSVLLAKISADKGIPYVFTSSDLVFNGKSAPYNETDLLSPLSIYAQQKVEAEQKILSVYPKAAICRMPLMFGNTGNTGKSMMQSLLDALNQGKSINLFSDEYRTPLNAEQATLGIQLALEKVQGIIHLGSTERISRFDLGMLIKKAFKINTGTINATLQQDYQTDTPRPADVSLDISRARSIGFNPPSINDQVKSLVV